MEIRNRKEQEPFTTKDGSTIRSLLDLSNAPVKEQSLAEATLPSGGSTERHYHQVSEEFYYILKGSGVMEINGEERAVGPGDAILIPAGAGMKSKHLMRCSFFVAPRRMLTTIPILSS